MEYALDLLELAVLGYLAWKMSTQKPPEKADLHALVKDALHQRIKDGGGRERLRALIAARQARKNAEQ